MISNQRLVTCQDWSSTLCLHHSEAPPRALEGASWRIALLVPGALTQEPQMTGNQACEGLLLSNESLRDARPPTRRGSRGCRLGPWTPLPLPEGGRAGAIEEPPGDSNASSQPWAASRWDGAPRQAGPAAKLPSYIGSDWSLALEVPQSWSCGVQLPSP